MTQKMIKILKAVNDNKNKTQDVFFRYVNIFFLSIHFKPDCTQTY